MVAMAKKSKAKGVPNRAPSWKLFARIAPELEAEIKAYCERQEPFQPTISQAVERGLRLLLAEETARRGG